MTLSSALNGGALPPPYLALAPARPAAYACASRGLERAGGRYKTLKNALRPVPTDAVAALLVEQAPPSQR